MLELINIKEWIDTLLDFSNLKDDINSFSRELLKRSYQYWEEGQDQLAEELAKDYIKLNPDLNWAYIFNAAVKTSKDKFVKSEKILTKIGEGTLTDDEKTAKQFLHACNHFYQMKYEEAIAFCDEEVKLSKYAKPYIIRAMAMQAQEEYKEAIVDYRKAKRDRIQSKNIDANIGFCQLQNGNTIQAYFTFKKIVDFFPINYKVNYNTALCHFRLSRFQTALKYLNNVERLNPDFSGTYLTRGYIYLKWKDFHNAKLDWEKAAALGDEDVRALIDEMTI